MANSRTFKKGDSVMIELDVEILQLMQESCGRWHNDMPSAINQVGTVKSAADDVVVVKYSTGKEFSFNPEVLSRYQSSKPGDLVRIEADENIVRRLQKDHGEWVDPMRTALGELGVVKGQFATGDLRVRVACSSWTMNPCAMEKVTEAELQRLKEKYKDDTTYRPGDIIQLLADEERVKSLQVDHGEWIGQMKSALGCFGFVKRVYDDKDLRVKVKGQSWTVNPLILVKIASVKSRSNDFGVGTKVRILADVNRVTDLQMGHGEWVDQMRPSIGRVGTIEKIFTSGDIRVKVMGRSWTINPKSLNSLPVDCTDDDTNGFSIGDNVRIHHSEAFIKEQQKDHGGWVDQMNPIPGKVGKVETVLANGDIKVKVLEQTWTLNSTVLTKLSSDVGNEEINIGDKVRVSSNEAEVRAKQDGHGGYIDIMKIILGEVGVVESIYPSGDIKVKVMGIGWCMNPEIVVKVASDGDAGGKQADIAKFMSEMISSSSTGSVFAAAALGDIPQLQRLLAQGKDANESFLSYTPLHIASHNGHTEVVKILLKHKVNLQSEDEDGDTPLHMAVYGNELGTCKLLIEAGTDPSSRNRKAKTPLTLAAKKGCSAILKFLIEKKSDINAQDADGNTPLHHAITSSKDEAVQLLLDADAKIDIRNQKGLIPFHLAAAQGYAEGVKLLIGHYKKKEIAYRVDEKKEDGFTALHLAAINNRIETLQVLIMMGEAELDLQSGRLHTALHLAIAHNHLECVKILVNAGCNVNIGDNDNDTPLHESLRRVSLKFMKNRSGNIPGSQGIQARLLEALTDLAGMEFTDDTDEIAVFIAGRGADITIRNDSGQTPIDLCLNEDITARVVSVASNGPNKLSTTRPTSTIKTEPAKEARSSGLVESHNSPDTEIQRNVQAEQRENAVGSGALASGDPDDPLWQECMKLSKEYERLKSDNSCPICLENNRNMVFNCGHATCTECSTRLTECPICRIGIISRIKYYY